MLHEGEHNQLHEFQWDNWQIKGEIGAGAFSKVYAVVKEEFGTTYEAALKHISIPRDEKEYTEAYNVSFSSEEQAWSYYTESVHRLQKEIDLMFMLQGHSHIVNYQAHRIDRKKNMPGFDVYIRMEKLKPLKEIVKEPDALSQDDVIKIGLDICDALKKVHLNNILHRDIKLENVFYGQGEYKLGDFGVSRTVGHTNKVTTAGTPNYMAPEIYHRNAVTYSADIYSLGIMLYRLLNGNRAPFLPGDKSVTTTQTQEEDAFFRRMKGEALPALPGVPEALMQVVLKACAFQPEARYQSAQEMAWALEGCRTGAARPQTDSLSFFTPEPATKTEQKMNAEQVWQGSSEATVIVPVQDEPAPEPASEPRVKAEPAPQTTSQPAAVPVAPVMPQPEAAPRPSRKASVAVVELLAVAAQFFKELGAWMVKAARSAGAWVAGMLAALGGLFKGRKKVLPPMAAPSHPGNARPPQKPEGMGSNPQDPWGLNMGAAPDLPGGGDSKKMAVAPGSFAPTPNGNEWDPFPQFVPSRRRFSLSPELLKIGGIAVAAILLVVLLILGIGSAAKPDTFALRSKVEPNGGIVLSWDSLAKASCYEVEGGVVDENGQVEWRLLKRVERSANFYVSLEFVRVEEVAYRVTAVTTGGKKIESNVLHVFPQGK